MWLAVIAILLILCFFYLNKKKRDEGLENFPEPPANFFLGHCLLINSPNTLLQEGSEIFKQYGKTVKVRLGLSFNPLRLGLLTSDYNLFEFILSSSQILKKSENYFYLSPCLGKGLLLSYGSRWKRHRKILTPAFHFEILKEFIEVFERVGDVLVSKLEEHDGHSSVNLDPLVTLCTLDVICETAMGTKINAQQGENIQYVKSVKDMCQIAIRRCLSPLKIFRSTYWLTQDYYDQKEALKILHNFTKEVVNSKKGIKVDSSKKKMAFLDLILKFSKEDNILSDEEIREEVDTFMFAGHDTTSAGICFTLYCLANNPEVQEKVYQEQMSLFENNKNPKVTITNLQSMKYLDHVIKESLRLYPPVPVLGRCTTEEIEFEGSLIHPQTNIVLFIYTLHRDPEFFPDPEKFIPERFDNLDSALPYAYIPFSAGPRNCIGQKFAMLELKSIISKVVRNFEIKSAYPKHEVQLTVAAVLKSVNGVKVAISKRC